MFVQQFRALIDRFDAIWRSDASSVVGVFLAMAGLASSSVGFDALQDLGVPAEMLKKLAAIAVVAGALLVTPKKQA